MTDIRSAIARTAAIATAVLLTAAISPAVGHAQAIEACYAPKTGSVYRIKAEGAPTQCAKGHAYFSWSAKSEITGLTFLASADLTVAPGAKLGEALTCPAGKTPIQVGWQQWENAQFPGHAPLQLINSKATHAYAKPVGWYFQFYNPTSVPIPFKVFLECADANVSY